MKYTFDEKDYNSNDGMMTSIWGPPLWHVLHTISFNYPIRPTKKQKEHYYNYFKNLKNILPCKYCRDNYKNNLKESKFGKRVFKNRNTLSKWVFKLHNCVNKNLGKKCNLTYKMVRERYEHFRSRCIIETKEKSKIENGCVESLYGLKSKCTLNIIPRSDKTKSFTVDPKCILKKLNKNK